MVLRWALPSRKRAYWTLKYFANDLYSSHPCWSMAKYSKQLLEGVKKLLAGNYPKPIISRAGKPLGSHYSAPPQFTGSCSAANGRCFSFILRLSTDGTWLVWGYYHLLITFNAEADYTSRWKTLRWEMSFSNVEPMGKLSHTVGPAEARGGLKTQSVHLNSTFFPPHFVASSKHFVWLEQILAKSVFIILKTLNNCRCPFQKHIHRNKGKLFRELLVSLFPYFICLSQDYWVTRLSPSLPLGVWRR